MHTKRTIALIGDDELAKELATALAKGNNRILLFSHSFETAKSIATSVQEKNTLADIEALPCSYNASWEADIIIACVPFDELKKLAFYIKDVATQKIFVVATLEEESNVFHTTEVQYILTHTKIVKASFSIQKGEVVFHASANKQEELSIVNELLLKQEYNNNN